MFKASWVLGAREGFENVAAIRRNVFIEELGYDDTAIEDQYDGISAAVLVLDANERPVATGRLHPSAQGWKLGRIAVLPEARKRGYGDLVVRMLALRATETAPSADMVIESAASAEEFYGQYGFLPEGEPYEADGVQVRLLRVACADFKWNKYCSHCGAPSQTNNT